MPQFENIGTNTLIEMLSDLTEKFTHLFCHYNGTNPSQEYLSCKETLELIMTELGRRNLSLRTGVKPVTHAVDVLQVHPS